MVTLAKPAPRGRRELGASAPSLRPLRGVAIQVAVVVAFALLWQLFSATELSKTAMFPSFLETMLAFFELLLQPAFWAATGTTVYSWAVALFLSILIGVPLGIVIGRVPFIERSTSFAIDFLRTIPSFALIPVALLIIGISNSMVILIAVLAGVWPILIQSIYAAKAMDPVLRQVGRSFHLTFKHRLLYVIAPDVLAFVWPGLRLAVTVVLLVAIGAQLIGGAPGLGFEIQASLSRGNQADMMAYVVASMLLGLTFNFLLQLVQSKFLWWHPSFRKTNGT